MTVVDTSDAAFKRDAELYRVISRHDFKHVVLDIKPEEQAELAERIAQILSTDIPVALRQPMRPVQLVGFDDVPGTRDATRTQADAAVFRAIKQSGR